MSALSAEAHATGTLDDAVSANAVAEPLAARPVIRDVKIGKLPAASRDKGSFGQSASWKVENGERGAGGAGRGMTEKSKLGGRNGAVW